jgi:hypothetical protein
MGLRQRQESSFGLIHRTRMVGPEPVGVISTFQESLPAQLGFAGFPHDDNTDSQDLAL